MGYKKSITLAVLLTAASMLLGCGPSSDARYDSGYSDGYAEGYNTTGEIRATLVEGDWDDENYSKGYQDGRAAGAADCRAGR
jgi:hypothetical protein